MKQAYGVADTPDWLINGPVKCKISDGAVKFVYDDGFDRKYYLYPSSLFYNCCYDCLLLFEIHEDDVIALINGEFYKFEIAYPRSMFINLNADELKWVLSKIESL